MSQWKSVVVRKFVDQLHATSKFRSVGFNENLFQFAQIAFRGITGLVDFDQHGYRTSFSLDVMSINIDGFIKVCSFD